jgi:5-methyltetrahydrofolate--homocysteine methyltransferase
MEALMPFKDIFKRRYLDALEERILVFDGAMGTSLQEQHLTASHFGGEKTNGCIDYRRRSKPSTVPSWRPVSM